MPRQLGSLKEVFLLLGNTEIRAVALLMGLRASNWNREAGSHLLGFAEASDDVT
jgi:hypothetical protein